jgi:hypothetical protein
VLVRLQQILGTLSSVTSQGTCPRQVGAPIDSTTVMLAALRPACSTSIRRGLTSLTQAKSSFGFYRNRHARSTSLWNRLPTVLEPLLLVGKKPGRPSTWTRRQLIDGIRWRIRAGTPWRDVPLVYGSWQAVYGLFRRWRGFDDRLQECPVYWNETLVATSIDDFGIGVGTRVVCGYWRSSRGSTKPHRISASNIYFATTEPRSPAVGGARPGT